MAFVRGGGFDQLRQLEEIEALRIDKAPFSVGVELGDGCLVY